MRARRCDNLDVCQVLNNPLNDGIRCIAVMLRPRPPNGLAFQKRPQQLRKHPAECHNSRQPHNGNAAAAGDDHDPSERTRPPSANACCAAHILVDPRDSYVYRGCQSGFICQILQSQLQEVFLSKYTFWFLASSKARTQRHPARVRQPTARVTPRVRPRVHPLKSLSTRVPNTVRVLLRRDGTGSGQILGP